MHSGLGFWGESIQKLREVLGALEDEWVRGTRRDTSGVPEVGGQGGKEGTSRGTKKQINKNKRVEVHRIKKTITQVIRKCRKDNSTVNLG